MDIKQAIESRHSVRSYINRNIKNDIKIQLEDCIIKCNLQSGLNIQLITDEPNTFGKSFFAHYGKFQNVNNYIVLIGKKDKNTEIHLGYYGEIIVLKAQQLGLNTCWVGLSYNKSKIDCTINKTEKIYAVIAIGYGADKGKTHKSKSPYQICKDFDSTPEWFQDGIKAALLAPTAMNQQKFHFFYSPMNKVSASTSRGFYSKMDLGIAKLHFEIGAGVENFEWL